jgi:hypothetical protein
MERLQGSEPCHACEHETEPVPAEGATKRPYVEPELCRHGSLRLLTGNAFSPYPDDQRG